MKTLKKVLLGSFIYFGIAGAIFGVSSCEQDSCTVLNCLNGGRCEDGLCQCPEGYEGAECESAVADRYAGVYGGTVLCNYNELLFPIVPDSVRIDIVERPNKVKLEIKAGNTSLQNFVGTVVDGNNIAFEPLISHDAQGNEIVRVDAFVDLDGNLIKVFLKTTNHLNEEKQACSFIGKRHVDENES